MVRHRNRRLRLLGLRWRWWCRLRSRCLHLILLLLLLLLAVQVADVRFVVVDDGGPQVGRVGRRQGVQLAKDAALVHRAQLVDRAVQVAVVPGRDFRHERGVVVVQPATGPVLDRSALQGAAGWRMVGVVVMLYGQNFGAVTGVGPGRGRWKEGGQIAEALVGREDAVRSATSSTTLATIWQQPPHWGVDKSGALALFTSCLITLKFFKLFIFPFGR
uniref:(northern house mosquito) hypothetical protein n=1 Tax=Culex pipiens TaxID=7175 RepID=A0A8D8N091_CULPI